RLQSAFTRADKATGVAMPDDPNVGWSFLRKLIQLPVLLPSFGGDDAVRKLLDEILATPGTAMTANRPASAESDRFAASSTPTADGNPEAAGRYGADVAEQRTRRDVDLGAARETDGNANDADRAAPDAAGLITRLEQDTAVREL